MTKIFDFISERKARIDSYSRDARFKALSLRWLKDSMSKKYVYNFEWLGRPIIQYPQDIVAIQEIIWETRPDIIVETGIAHGGSLILSASMLALLDICDAMETGEVIDPRSFERFVIGIDIDIRSHNRAAIESHPLSRYIRLVEGSSIDPKVIDKVSAQTQSGKRIMVCLDSSHTHEHVLAELEGYGSLVTQGCYCVVFDTFIEDMPTNFFADRDWNVGNNPKTALSKYLETHPEFFVDGSFDDKLAITAAPRGYLRRLDVVLSKN